MHRRNDFGIEIDDNGLDGSNGLLDRRDLGNLPFGNPSGSAHQGNDQISSLLPELHQWQSVILKMIAEHIGRLFHGRFVGL